MKKETDTNKNLKNIIRNSFIKLNYFISIYTEIIKDKYNIIKIILFFDKNELEKKYINIILTYIDIYKFIFKSQNYELYFDLIYTEYSSKKFTLDYISKQMDWKKKEIKKLKENTKILENALEYIIKNVLEKNKLKDPNL